MLLSPYPLVGVDPLDRLGSSGELFSVIEVTPGLGWG
jgi:hypothetical protein